MSRCSPNWGPLRLFLRCARPRNNRRANWSHLRAPWWRLAEINARREGQSRTGCSCAGSALIAPAESRGRRRPCGICARRRSWPAVALRAPTCACSSGRAPAERADGRTRRPSRPQLTDEQADEPFGACVRRRSWRGRCVRLGAAAARQWPARGNDNESPPPRALCLHAASRRRDCCRWRRTRGPPSEQQQQQPPRRRRRRQQRRRRRRRLRPNSTRSLLSHWPPARCLSRRRHHRQNINSNSE